MSSLQTMAGAAAAGVASIRIISRAHEGFRRGGIGHPADATYPLSFFTAGQLKLIQDEPLLTTIVTAPSADGEVDLSIRTAVPQPPAVSAGIVDPPLPAGTTASPEAPKSMLTAIEREAALLGLVPGFTIGDFTQAGMMRADARRRLAARLGFEPSDDEIRAAGEAYVKLAADQAG